MTVEPDVRVPSRTAYRQNHAARLRIALLSEVSQSVVDAIARPLVEQCFVSLLTYCDRIAYSARNQMTLTGDDLAQEAWRKLLEYLKGSNGDRIKDDAHFERLLRCAAKTVLLDAIKKAKRNAVVSLDEPRQGDFESDGVERIRDTAPTPEEWMLPTSSHSFLLIQMLFKTPERFHARFRQKNQRHWRQYQALVLYQMAELYRTAAIEIPPDSLQMEQIGQFVELLGIPEGQWSQIETITRADAVANAKPTEGIHVAVLAAVNSVCGTKITQRKTLITYRAEMNKFVELSGKFWEERDER